MRKLRKTLCLLLAWVLLAGAAPGTARAELVYNVDVTTSSPDYRIYIELGILNRYRTDNGLEPLTLDVELTKAAMQRAAEISVFYEGTHMRPNGTAWYTTPGIHGNKTGENIAYGFSDASSAMTAWENSPSHNANLLNKDFKSVGLGFFCPTPGEFYWTQDFSSDKGQELVIDPTAASKDTAYRPYTVEMLSSNLTPGVLGDREVMVGASTQLRAIVANKGFSGEHHTEVTVSQVESLTPDIASAKLDPNGYVLLTGLAPGTAQLRFRIGSNCTFTISRTVLESDLTALASHFDVDTSSEVYTGRPHYKWVETDLINHTDYEISYKDTVNAGTATLIITGQGRYSGTLEYHFTIEKAERTFDPGISNKLYTHGGTRAAVWPRDNAGRDLSYRFTSSNTNVVKVDSQGELYAVAPGYSTITIEADETDNYKAGSATLEVMVTEWSFEDRPSVETPPPGSPGAGVPASQIFRDVKAGSWYEDAVSWAVNHEPQITDGTSTTTFSPDDPCTKAHIITFLWRAYGCPEPGSLTGPFRDLKADWYRKAALWAAEMGIVDSGTYFHPDDPCTRAQAVTYMWLAAGCPGASGSKSSFKDVPSTASYAEAVAWAVNREPQITDGTSATTFSPNTICTRGHIATFLYRGLGE